MVKKKVAIRKSAPSKKGTTPSVPLRGKIPSRSGKKSKAGLNIENLLIFIALIVLNVLFVLHFWLAAIGVIVGFVFAAFGMMVGGLIGIISGLVYPLIASGWLGQYVNLAGVHPAGAVLLSLAVFCFGGLWMIGNYLVITYFVKAAKWYFDLNVRAFKKYEP